MNRTVSTRTSIPVTGCRKSPCRIRNILGIMRARWRPLINSFAPVAGQDRLTVYRSLVTADRDVIGIRAAIESNDGSPGLKDDANLANANGSRDMIREENDVDGTRNLKAKIDGEIAESSLVGYFARS